MYPRITVSGEPRERGRQYGEQAREQIALCREGYEAVFGASTGWTWPQAVQAAEIYREPIAAHVPDALLEMEGIAQGAGLDFGDVLAINARTEIIWAATARLAAAQRASLAVARECTAFATLGSRTVSGRPLLGQNWDWLVQGFDTVVVLEVEQAGERPNFVTVVEAGLLAKASLNSAGVGICTNALVTSRDRGEPGIPYHVVLRRLADCETVTDAIDAVQQLPRSSAGNYLVGHADDIAINLETAPGDHRNVSWQLPDEGVLIHTNHFLELPAEVEEVSVYAMPDSLVRLQRATGKLRDDHGRRWDLSALAELLTDHADWPGSLCCHPDPRKARTEQWATVMSVVIDPAERLLWLASGNPCTHEFEPLSFGPLLDKPTSLRQATVR